MVNPPHPNSMAKKLAVGTHLTLQAKKIVPPDYHVTISSKLDTAGMIEEVETMAGWARMVHQALCRSEAHPNTRAASAFGAFTMKLTQTLGKLKGRGYRPETYGDLDEDALLEVKRGFAEILSNHLTKLNWAFNGPHMRDLWDRNGVMQNWAARDCLNLMRQSRSTIETWAKLLAWERQRYGRTEAIDNTAEAYQNVIDGTATSH